MQSLNENLLCHLLIDLIERNETQIYFYLFVEHVSKSKILLDTRQNKITGRINKNKDPLPVSNLFSCPDILVVSVSTLSLPLNKL